MNNKQLNSVSRRGFLRGASLGVGIPVVSGLLAACAQQAPAAPAAAQHEEPDHTSDGTMSYQEMDAKHEAGIKAFVEGVQTQGRANQPMEPRLDGDVKVFDLECAKTQWEVTPGRFVEAWTYNGTMPGPEIRVTEGDIMRMVVTNKLDESTAVHPHGVMVPNNMDGVPFITQPPIRPGETFTYEFVAKNPGSHMYHSHYNSTKQVGKGLLGALIIEPKNRAQDPEYDLDYTMIINDQNGGFTLNGKGFPATEPIVAKLGQKLRVRYMNEGLLIHPMHLHGLPQLVFARDGWNLPQPYLCDTVNVVPGERWDVIVDCSEPGVWAFHCHVLSHAENEHGMFGMVTALIIS
ncbi:MAG TPA: copper oxidase [Roseiflexaceae bacterium]|nr:copper oxidase [Roseiflexaceae bacterium]HMP43021.1 copper oxidase [Roseiflexaceae bacterium]